MSHILDADVFIRAKNLHYGFDFCPAFWEWLDMKNAAGQLFSIEKVGDEVRAMPMNCRSGLRPKAPVSFSARTVRSCRRWRRSASGPQDSITSHRP